MIDSQLNQVAAYLHEVMASYHSQRLEKLSKLQPKSVLLRKNPYIFLCKNLETASEFAELILQAHASSSEETLFGQLLEDLAIFVSEMMFGGSKSTTTGIDLDFTRNGVRYLVAIKSSKNWGNSGSHTNLERDFATAKRVAAQSKLSLPVTAVLGVCYGNSKNQNKGNYEFYAGQGFWDFISGDPDFYKKIVEPLGHEADMRDALYRTERAKALNRFELYILSGFCDSSGVIDWGKFVEFNSKNLP